MYTSELLDSKFVIKQCKTPGNSQSLRKEKNHLFNSFHLFCVFLPDDIYRAIHFYHAGIREEELFYIS